MDILNLKVLSSFCSDGLTRQSWFYFTCEAICKIIFLTHQPKACLQPKVCNLSFPSNLPVIDAFQDDPNNFKAQQSDDEHHLVVLKLSDVGVEGVE